MRKDLNERVVPHPTEYIVMVGDKVLPITGGVSFTRIASFVHKSHAEKFADSIKSFHTAVIEPDQNPNNELIIRIERAPVGDRVYDKTPYYSGGILIKPEGWDG